MFRKENNYSIHQKKSPFLDILIKIASCSFSVCAVNPHPMALQDSRAEGRDPFGTALVLALCSLFLPLPGSSVGYSTCKLFGEMFAYPDTICIRPKSCHSTLSGHLKHQGKLWGCFGRAGFGRMESSSPRSTASAGTEAVAGLPCGTNEIILSEGNVGGRNTSH